MTRPRDSQATKVFKALDIPTPTLDLTELQRTADRLVKQVWFARRLPESRIRKVEKYSVVFVPAPHSSCSAYNYCQLGVYQRNMIGLLHQISHYMLPDTVAWHGPEFARLMLELVGHVGLDPTDTSNERRIADRLALKESYAQHNVKWRAFSPEARENARARWYERDLRNLAAELQEDEVT